MAAEPRVTEPHVIPVQWVDDPRAKPRITVRARDRATGSTAELSVARSASIDEMFEAWRASSPRAAAAPRAGAAGGDAARGMVFRLKGGGARLEGARTLDELLASRRTPPAAGVRPRPGGEGGGAAQSSWLACCGVGEGDPDGAARPEGERPGELLSAAHVLHFERAAAAAPAESGRSFSL